MLINNLASEEFLNGDSSIATPISIESKVFITKINLKTN